MVPPESVDSNIFAMSDREMKRKKIEQMPETLGEAIEVFRRSSFMKEVLGDHIYSKYLEAKETEWRLFRAHVTDWEVERYLNQY